MASILIVDDHPAICFALKVILEKDLSFTVTTSSGERLLQQININVPDLLILDLELKHCDGLDILPRIKQHHPTLHVLIFTNQSAQIYALRTLQAGADGFVSKTTPLASVAPLCQLILEGYQCFPKAVISALQEKTIKYDNPQEILARLSDREIAVLHYLKIGKTNKEIAEQLTLSNKTISTYKTRILEKSGCDSLETLFSLLGSYEEEVE